MPSVAQAYRNVWTPETRDRLSAKLQGYGQCLRQNVSVSGDFVIINKAGYKKCGSSIRQLMRSFMRQGT